MKKISLVLLMLFGLFFQTNAQKSKHYTQRVRVQQGSLTAYFYIAGDDENLYWGCNDSIVPYKENNGVYSLVSADGTKITAMPVERQSQQNNLSAVFGDYIMKKKMQPKEAFEKIFDFYRTHNDWTKLLIEEL